MKFFARIKDIIIRLLTKIKCNSSCFNTINNIDDHSMKVERIEESREFQIYINNLIKNSERQEVKDHNFHSHCSPILEQS